MWLKLLVVALSVIGAAIISAWTYGDLRWSNATDARLVRLHAARLPQTVRTAYFEAEIQNLPPPVQHYFRAVLRPGQPLITATRLRHEGEFRVGDAHEHWKPMSAVEEFSTRPPGFVWDARIWVLRQIDVRVRDSYIAGSASTSVQLLGLFTIIDVQDIRQLAIGALQRYLAEAVWFPTALLPSQGVEWAGVDEFTSRATIMEGKTAASIDFRFNAKGEITGAFTANRPRMFGRSFIRTPWMTRCSNYTQMSGMRIPLQAEAEWLLPEGPLPYFRARITDVSYAFSH
jgi:hypothetical protein